MVVVLGLVLFRTKLGEVVQRLREADTPVGTMRFDPSDQAGSNQGITESASTLVETVRTGLESAGDSDPEGWNPNAVGKGWGMQDIQDDVEAVIRASFAAGFRLSKAFDSQGVQIDRGRTPSPMIEWESSTPQVVGYEMHVPDYPALRESFDTTAKMLAKLDNLSDAFDPAIEVLSEEIEKARREGDREKVEELEKMLLEGTRLRDRILTEVENLKVTGERISKARLAVPFRRQPRA